MILPTILTGLRANNDLTLGNYFGAMLPIVDMSRAHADEYNVNMFIPDLHSFTTPIDHSELYTNTLKNAKMFAAAGLDLSHPNIHMYRQSFVPAHSELTWILDCFTGVGEMNRMTQFKDKSSGLGDTRTTVGLFNYPVLMAADVLLYNASYVPVGDDQTQHLEYIRDIAQRMNEKFGDLFVVPEPVKKQHAFFGKDQGLRIMDLANPTKKMSKSDDSGKGVIFLGDDPDDAAKKIMSATTDDKASIRFDRDTQPGITNLLQISALLAQKSQEDINTEWEGKTKYGEFKASVAEQVREFLLAFQSRYEEMSDDVMVTHLEASEREMNLVANQTLLTVQRAVGLRPAEHK